MKRSRLDVGCLGNRIVELPPELWELILGKLDLLGYHCFSVVCKSWRSIAIEARLHEESKKEKLIINYFPFRPHHHDHHQLPYLMFPSPSDRESRQLCFSFSPSKFFMLELPEFNGRRCVGSSLGWLIMTSQKGDNYLLNPASRVQIQLPRLDSMVSRSNPIDCETISDIMSGLWLDYRFFICKAILFEAAATTTTKMINGSKNENGMDCIVVAIYRKNSLAFCRATRGDDQQQVHNWTAIEYDHNPKKKSDFEDIIFYNGQLYAVCDDFSLAIVILFPDDRNPIRATKCNIPPPANYDQPSFSRSERRYVYLVESIGGELLMVIRHYEFVGLDTGLEMYFVPKTTGFEIFKLDIRIPGWVEVKSLGNQMLFLGTSHSVSFSAGDFPELGRNCIFFTEDAGSCNRCRLFYRINKPSRDIGVFSLESKSVMPFLPEFYHHSSSLSPPFWFTPNPW